MSRILDKLNAIRGLASQAAPSGAPIRDSLRLQGAPYQTQHTPSGLVFDLESGVGDWFTFYECCIRQDYFAHGAEPKPGDQVLDIGGNFGAFSLIAATKVGEAGRVHCYEPSPTAFGRIQSHVSGNGLTNLTVFNAAVAGASGKAELAEHAKSAFNHLTHVHDKTRETRHSVVEVDVVGINDALDRLPGEISLAKIDCEGAEYEIFDKLSDDDLLRIRALAIETHPVPGRSRNEIVGRLEGLGFAIQPGNPFLAFNRKRMT